MKVEEIILDRIDKLDSKMDVCLVDIAGLKVKSGVWGAVAGMIPVLIGIAMLIAGVI